MEQQRVQDKMGPQIGVGTGLMGLSFGLAVVVALMGLGMRPRRAFVALGPVLIVVAYIAVKEAGITSMIVSALLAVALIYYTTGAPDPRKPKEVDEFRKFPVRREIVRELHTDYRISAVKDQLREIEQQTILKQVDALPIQLARILPAVGIGQSYAYFQLRRDLAYVAFVQCDDYSDVDYVSVLMLLEQPAPAFAVKPLAIVDGVLQPNLGLKFGDDAFFSTKYVVEPARGADPRVVRAFMSPVVRDELLSLPNAFLHVQGNVMALTVYGPWDADMVDHLVDVSDVVFAEYGAAGGPSLLEPEDAEPLGGERIVKKKKKKRKPADAGSPPKAPPASPST
jgi:hypothetical protein